MKDLIKKHLAWSGSDKEMPSRDLDNVRGRFIDACREGCYTVDEWDLLNEDAKQGFFIYCSRRFADAAAKADRKWEAVKVMLDLWIPNRPLETVAFLFSKILSILTCIKAQ